MKTFEESFSDIDALTQTELKPILAIYAKLGEEFGETGEALLITEGHIKHKELKEPLVGEIADVCQMALSLFVKSTPNLTKRERMELFLTHLECKNKKWAKVQEGEIAAICRAEIDNIEQTRDENVMMQDLAPKAPEQVAAENAVPTGGSHDIEKRTLNIVSEQLGLSLHDIRTHLDIVNDLGADSLDTVELLMAIEDEFEFEVSDEDAEKIRTPQQIIDYVKFRFGLVKEVYTDPATAYTIESGRYLTLEERMQERSLHNNQRNNIEDF